MARGWESKSIEAQMEEGKERALEEHKPRRLTPEERERQQHLKSLELSRSRLLAQLELATNEAYREVLKKGLQAIEQQIGDFKGNSSSH